MKILFPKINKKVRSRSSVFPSDIRISSPANEGKPSLKKTIPTGNIKNKPQVRELLNNFQPHRDYLNPTIKAKKFQREKTHLLSVLKFKSKRKIFAIFLLLSLFSSGLLFLKYKSIYFDGTKSRILNPQADPKKEDLLIKVLNEKSLQFESLESKNNHFEIILKDQTKVLLADDNVENDVRTLQLIIERFTIEGRRLNLIDLRFDKPVIR